MFDSISDVWPCRQDARPFLTDVVADFPRAFGNGELLVSVLFYRAFS